METSWKSTSGSSVTYSGSGTGSGSTVQTSDYNSTMGVSSPSGEDTQSGTTLAVGGDAVAVGEETVATGDIDLAIIDMGTTVVASGSSDFEASAETSDGSTAYASTDSTVEPSEGGKTVFWNIETSNTLQTDDGASWDSSSTTGVVAIYDDGLAGEAESPTSGAAPSSTSEPVLNVDSTQITDPGTGDMQTAYEFDGGNIATLDLDAAVVGEDTFLSVDVSILTVENQLSSVSALAIGGVG